MTYSGALGTLLSPISDALKGSRRRIELLTLQRALPVSLEMDVFLTVTTWLIYWGRHQNDHYKMFKSSLNQHHLEAWMLG